MAAYALGFRVKSGHAIAVALRGPVQSPVPLARVSVALSDPSIQATKQPYHAGFGTARIAELPGAAVERVQPVRLAGDRRQR